MIVELSQIAPDLAFRNMLFDEVKMGPQKLQTVRAFVFIKRLLT